MGNLDQADKHFKSSLAFYRSAGYRPELAWTCCDCAEGDRAKAMSLLGESLAISRKLGMQPLMKRVVPRQGILETKEGPRSLLPTRTVPIFPMRTV